MNATYLTPEGLKKLQEELEYLRTVKRKEVAERLHAALEEGGDLTENAEYEAAKNEQAFVEGRIQELEHLLASAKVIEDMQRDVVDVGCTVTVEEEDGMVSTYTIVGQAEAAPQNGLISNESPLGKALMGHKVGDEVEVRAPGGQFKVRILKVE
ncbi:MAG TPA: transcription elongation factor GreA [Anaerolineae bacterium]|nr:transcription elongation factor GreA [Anaerolineae bacterium]HID84262.1 transcription elongation factor GreA [Anaerolineales bacterium]HIQ09148.1 transcription elongation factor GreA [Anaerolineaceae bacterium]